MAPVADPRTAEPRACKNWCDPTVSHSQGAQTLHDSAFGVLCAMLRTKNAFVARKRALYFVKRAGWVHLPARYASNR